MHDPKGQGLSHWTPKAAANGPNGPEASAAMLEKNLKAMVGTSLAAVKAIMAAGPRYDLEFMATDEGVPTATMQELLSAPRQLASRRRPLSEGKSWAEDQPIDANAALVVPGFGLGYHLAALAERMGRTGVIICFEPDAGLLRAVLERVDHTGWLTQTNFVLLTEASEPAQISQAVSGFEGYLASGTKIIEHPISRGRLGAASDEFGKHFASIIRAVRTNVITTMVQMQTSIHNMGMNLAHYALGEGVAELEGAAKGHPAVIVAAGPSLERNIAELAKPGVRDRVVIIATQTTLKPLLARGIKPHFVTALDYHEVSRRFYEGLTAQDVDGVTLVVEPQANGAILDAFPGRIRCPREEVLDAMLGEKLHRPMGRLPKGATVAHLAYYLARHLGCDPVIMIGQDLGFTDGQYYAAGAQIHSVWGSELNPFRSLEMFEWERVKRMGGALRRAKDASGKDIYSDEQMSTYLVQFERDFLADKERGLKTLDATEGGVAKAHTVTITLRRALETYAGKPIRWRDGLVDSWRAPQKDKAKADAIAARLREVRRDVLALEKLTVQTKDLLTRIVDNQKEQALVNRLIAQVDANRDKAVAFKTAFWLTQYMNQAGALRRFKADRAIDIDTSSDEFGKQRLQLERDLENMKALRESAEMVGTVLEESLQAFVGGAKAYRPKFEREAASQGGVQGKNNAAAPARTIGAVLIADADMSGMGTPRDLATPIAGDNALRWTLHAIAKSKHVRNVVIATDQVERIRTLVGESPAGLRVTIEAADLTDWRAQRRYRVGGRLWARNCWRGGAAGLSVYDEAIDPHVFDVIAKKHAFNAVVGIGCDWALLDPVLLDAVAARHLEDPEQHKITFTHAAPGLGTMLLSADTIADVAHGRSKIGIFATPAAMLGFVPVAPQFDPIARTNCIVAPTPARDAARRMIPDSPAGCRAASDVLAEIGVGAPCETSAPLFASCQRAFSAVDHLVIELTTRRTGGSRFPWEAGTPAIDISPAALERAIQQVQELSAIRPIGVTLGGRGDPLEFAEWERVIADLRKAGAAGIHVRTQLAQEASIVDRLLKAQVDIVSVDMLTFAQETYSKIAGVDLWGTSKVNTESLMSARGTSDSLPQMLVVPRMTKCDLTLAEMELFYDYWIMKGGAAAIDPLPGTRSDERLRPLPIPASARERLAAATMGFRADGTIIRTGDDRLMASPEPARTPAAKPNTPTNPSTTRTVQTV